MSACENSPIANFVETKKSEKELSWVDRADPEFEASADYKAGDFKFYKVCGFSCQSAGISYMDSERCFPEVPQITIEGTSDYLLSEEHARLNSVAYNFATVYNQTIAKLMRTHGDSKCNENVDWSAALNSLDELMWSLSDDFRMKGSVWPSLEREDDKTDFVIQLPGKITNELKQKLCISTKDDLHDELFSIEVKSSKDVDDVQIIKCKNGSTTNAT